MNREILKIIQKLYIAFVIFKQKFYLLFIFCDRFQPYQSFRLIWNIDHDYKRIADWLRLLHIITKIKRNSLLWNWHHYVYAGTSTKNRHWINNRAKTKSTGFGQDFIYVYIYILKKITQSEMQYDEKGSSRFLTKIYCKNQNFPRKGGSKGPPTFLWIRHCYTRCTSWHCRGSQSSIGVLFGHSAHIPKRCI